MFIYNNIIRFYRFGGKTISEMSEVKRTVDIRDVFVYFTGNFLNEKIYRICIYIIYNTQRKTKIFKFKYTHRDIYRTKQIFV